MSKKYFLKESIAVDDLRVEHCYEIDTIKDMMKFAGLTEAEVYIAKPVYGEDYFWCTEFMEPGDKNDTCGKMCDKYKPRNGKNGRCKYSSHCYEPVGEPITIKLKS